MNRRDILKALFIVPIATVIARLDIFYDDVSDVAEEMVYQHNYGNNKHPIKLSDTEVIKRWEEELYQMVIGGAKHDIPTSHAGIHD